MVRKPPLSITRPHPLADAIPPAVATAWGEDSFGPWFEFEVGGVAVRMRWAPPGTFWMGSPKGEAGRREHEGPRHRVTLTRGFWMAEHPCTQALWEAVMDRAQDQKNPSRFRSPDRPVESVSFDDVVGFLARLNERVPGLEVCLPTEAQWEYACRGGTKTSTYAGELVIEGINNAPLLDAIAWYGGNSGVDFELEEFADSTGWREKQHDHSRAGSHPVGRRQPNALGLHDMLGNVDEWCADWWAERYEAGPQSDPVGPAAGEARVLRGGSWLTYARGCRAAYRGRNSPGDRIDFLGFRLARGPQPWQAGSS